MNEFLQRAIEEAMRNRMTDEAKAKALRDFNEGVSDWYGTCPRCKAEVRGTLTQLRAHVCDNHS